ncbi:MAG TPA: hypothetical protein VG167_10285 [Verrucomicrobiae bacterium]|nr:hypothetical protein [Verrucomicrobiae bacterium]
MDTYLMQTLRSRWFVTCVHVALWLVLYLAVVHADGHAPHFGEAPAGTVSTVNAIPVAKLDALLSPTQWTSLSDQNTPNPFFTRHFVPPPSPAPPPPATTRKIEVTYEGYFQTEDGPKRALVKLGDEFVSAKVGGLLTTDLFIAEATMQTLTLTNHAARTNLLLLNTTNQLEVPLK